MHIHFVRLGAATLALSLLAASTSAEVLEVGQPLARIALVKPGTHHYLRYMQEGEVAMPLDIWTRTVSITPRGMNIKQRWDAPGKPPSVKLLDSWFDAATMRPLSHTRITEKEGKKVVEGFVFSAEKVTGMQDLADNTQLALNVATPESTFNFEADIEFLQALPLTAGYEAVINFYHPGGGAPARYTFKVSGSASVAGPAGPVDCWVVTTDYNRPGTVSTFWFAKGTQVLVRQEGMISPGKMLYKTLID